MQNIKLASPDLAEQIKERRKEVATDGFPVSINELVSMYKEGEIEIHPEFQRFFRWTDQQKTRLVESILLGIPLPAIFVFQRGDGAWEVIDGLQRLSTLFEFVGVLRNQDGKRYPPLKLTEAKYLTALKGKTFKGEENSLSVPQQLLIKRSKIDAVILLDTSDKSVKYELFQRLNMGGTPLSAQEIRNCIFLMENKGVFESLSEMSQDPDFREVMQFSDKELSEQYDKEIVLRFLSLKSISEESLQKIKRSKDIEGFLTEETIRYAESDAAVREADADCFQWVFSSLNQALGANAMRRFDWDAQRFVGPRLLSPFEAVATGLGHHFDSLKEQEPSPEQLSEKVKSLWENETFLGVAKSGNTSATRLPRLIPLGRDVFDPTQFLSES